MIENQSENAENLQNNSQVEAEVNSADSSSKDQIENISNTEVNNDDDSLIDKTEILNSANDNSNTDARLEQLEKEHETLKNQYIRIAADFENFRKRQSRDQVDLKIQLISKSLTAILPIVDNFERARQQLKPESEEAQSLHRSYQGLYKQLVDVLKQQGVSPMRVVGQQFDPSLHEAVLREPSDQQKEDTIIEELQRGYNLEGKVLRHALVKVSMGPGPADNSQEHEEKDKVEEDFPSDKNSSDEK